MYVSQGDSPSFPQSVIRIASTFGGYVPVEQQRRLIARAREEDRSVSAILRRAIDGYLASPPGSGVMSLDQFRTEAAELQEQAMSNKAAL